MSESQHVVDVVRAEWCSVLEVTDARDSDEFFTLGGDSLRAMSLVTRIEESLGIEFPLDVLFVDGTLREIVRACQAAKLTTSGG